MIKSIERFGYVNKYLLILSNTNITFDLQMIVDCLEDNYLIYTNIVKTSTRKIDL